MNKTSVEKIQEHIKCGICLDTVTRPLMCPECSKMFCTSCMERSFLVDHRCPHCRFTIRSLKKFVKCNWVDQLSSDLNSLENISLCPTHNEPLSLFCHTCKNVICSHCALFAGGHEEHEIGPIKEICSYYTDEINQLYRDACRLRALTYRKNETLRKLLSNSHQQRLHNAKLTKSSIEGLISSLAKSQKSKIEDKTNCYKRAIDTLDICQTEIKDYLEMILSPSEYVQHAEVFIERIRYLITSINIGEADEDLLKETHDEDVASSNLAAVPDFTLTILKLYDFSHLAQERRIISSSKLSFYGVEFKLEVHFDTDMDSDNPAADTELSMFIYARNKRELDSKIVFSTRFEVVNQYGCKSKDLGKTMLLGIKSESEKKFRVPIALNISCLSDMGFIKPEIDCFVVRFGVRPVSYQMQCLLQDSYIRSLEQQLQEDTLTTGIVSKQPLEEQPSPSKFSGIFESFWSTLR